MKRALVLLIIASFSLRSYSQEFYCGIGAGVLVTHRSEGDRLQIVSVVPDSPAVRAGLAKNQIVSAIDGVPTVGLKLKDCIMRLLGKSGTKVILEIEDWRHGVTNSVEVVREVVPNDPLAIDPATWVEISEAEDRKSLSVGLNQVIRVSNTNGALALIQFTQFGTTNAAYRWRFHPSSNSPITTGAGVVFENYDKRADASGSTALIHLGSPDDLKVKAGNFRLEWSFGSLTNGWLYYNPLREKIDILESSAFDVDLK